MNKEEKKYRYPLFVCRLSPEVQEKLKSAKSKSAKSWNLFIKELIKSYENNRRKT